jgi:hypothetical protein
VQRDTLVMRSSFSASIVCNSSGSLLLITIQASQVTQVYWAQNNGTYGTTTNNVKNNGLENERRSEAEGHDGLGRNDDVTIAGVGSCDCAGTRT